jgi:ribulose-bisphosphate carboxylase large chain
MPHVIRPTSQPCLSGERFAAVYRIVGTEDEARARAEDLCVEQTVEFPIDLVPGGAIRDQIVARVESFEPAGDRAWLTRVSFAAEIAGGELSQLLNAVFGNISLQPGLRLERLLVADAVTRQFRGPRFGRQGMRDALGVHDRPLVCTALKPMGLSPDDLADLAYRFALGGIDLVKDDHGLADQAFATFDRRVSRCTAAVRRANRETGGRCVYAPNVTGGPDGLFARARLAKAAGCGALVVTPGLAGLDAMRQLADDEAIALPILSHPAFLGSYVVAADSGISPFALFGQIMRLAGADASIFPNFGGRFSISREACESLAAGTVEPMGSIRPILPAPGGGMSLARLPEIARVYGKDFIILIGGDLFRHGRDLTASCRAFRDLVAGG